MKDEEDIYMQEKQKLSFMVETTREDFQKILEDKEIAEELEKIVNSRYFIESHKSLVDNIRNVSKLIEKEDDDLEILNESSMEDFKRNIMFFIVKRSFAKCIENLSLNIKQDILMQLRDEKYVRQTIDLVKFEMEKTFRVIIQRMAAIGYLGNKI